LPIARLDCVHGASGMPSTGMTFCSGSSLRANTRLAPSDCGARVAMPTLDFACAGACGYVSWLAEEQFVIPPLSSLQYRSKNSFDPDPTSADLGLPFYPTWLFRHLCGTSHPTIRRHNDKKWPAYARDTASHGARSRRDGFPCRRAESPVASPTGCGRNPRAATSVFRTELFRPTRSEGSVLSPSLDSRRSAFIRHLSESLASDWSPFPMTYGHPPLWRRTRSRPRDRRRL